MQQQSTILRPTGRSKRVLLLAYACSPFKGSEPGIGWNRAIESAKYFETWVICKKEKYERDIKDYFAAHGTVPNLHFVFLPRTRFERWLKKVPIPGFWYLPYNLWHRRALGVATELHQKLHFDLCHQVNMCCFREPGYLWKMKIPFVWGPLGGTENAPWRLLRLAGWRGALAEGLRNVVNSLQLYTSLRVRKAARVAFFLLTGNSHGRDAFAKVCKVHPILLPNNGVSGVTQPSPKPSDGGRPLHILWSSMLKHNKCLPLLLKALANVPHVFRYKLRIIGGGPQEKSWRRTAHRLNLDPNCEWMGWLPHEEARKQYQWADIFVFTSLRDLMATVVLEALSYGVPVLCLDHSGNHDVVTDKCGIKVPVGKAKEVVSHLSDAIIRLCENRDELNRLSEGALERAKQYLWSVNGNQLAKIYQDVLASPKEKTRDFAHLQ